MDRVEQHRNEHAFQRQLTFDTVVAARVHAQIEQFHTGRINGEQAKAAMLQLTHEVSHEFVGLMMDLMHNDRLSEDEIEWIKEHWDDLRVSWKWHAQGERSRAIGDEW